MGDGEWELFDLWSDPWELRSVADEPAFEPTVRELKERLVQLREQYDVPVEDP